MGKWARIVSHTKWAMFEFNIASIERAVHKKSIFSFWPVSSNLATDLQEKERLLHRQF